MDAPESPERRLARDFSGFPQSRGITRLVAGHEIQAVSGPDQVVMRADVPLHGEGLSTVADFTVHNGQRVRFSMSHAPSHHLALIGTALVLDSVTTSL